jgi:hypothetical protein
MRVSHGGRRRPNGEGSFHFDEERGRWEARVTTGYRSDGSPILLGGGRQRAAEAMQRALGTA